MIQNYLLKTETLYNQIQEQAVAIGLGIADQRSLIKLIFIKQLNKR